MEGHPIYQEEEHKMIMKRLRIIIISLLFMKLILKESKSNKKQKPIRRI
jgi:hypothetical protein